MRAATRSFVALMWALVGMTSVASADLGAPVLDVVEGRVRIVAFAAPVPIRVGASTWRVFALDPATGEALPDLAIRMTFERPAAGDPHAAHRPPMPSRPVALGRDGVTVQIEFDVPGAWQWQVHVFASDAQGTATSVPIREVVQVLPKPGFWGAHGVAVLAPYALLGLYAGHRRFVVGRRRGRWPHPR
jgi:hypothetical protein